MIVKKVNQIPSSQITPESVYLRRREFLQRAGIGAAVAALPILSGKAALAAEDQY